MPAAGLDDEAYWLSVIVLQDLVVRRNTHLLYVVVNLSKGAAKSLFEALNPCPIKRVNGLKLV
jgi:hypothetical protein